MLYAAIQCAVMAYNASVPVRFNEDQDARLREISRKSGITVADLVRLAVDDLLAKIEKDGNITIPMRERYALSRANAPDQMNDKGGKPSSKLPSAETEAIGNAVERALKRRKP